MANFAHQRSAAYGSVQRQQQRQQLLGLNAFDRHKKMMADYVNLYGGKLPQPQQTVKTDLDVLHEKYRFIRSEEDDSEDSWGARLAQRYYAKLFKEYCIADLARYKEGKVGMRWRSEAEVIAGKGQFICGAKGCDERRGLASYEVNFGYSEAGEQKQALVKLRVCPEHAMQLNYRKNKQLLKAQAKSQKRAGKERDAPERAKHGHAEPAEGREADGGEIVAGIILGPSCLGRIKGYSQAIWPTAVTLTNGKKYDSLQTFNVVANVGLIFFMFLMGMELDRSLLRRKWKHSVPIAVSAILFPFGVGVASSLWMYDVNKEGAAIGWGPDKTAFTLFAGSSMSFTAFPVLAAILTSLNLLNSEVGLQAMSCAAIDDVLAWSTLAIASSFSKSGSPVDGLYTCLLAALYVAAMCFLVRPVLVWSHAWLAKRNLQTHRYYLCFIFIMVIASAFTTEVIGIHAFFGAFMAGLMMPTTAHYADELFHRMDLVVMEVLLPLFFASSGLRTNVGTLNTARYWGLTLAHHLDGVIALNVGLSLGILSQRMFTMLILMAVVTTIMTTPAMCLRSQDGGRMVDGWGM
ncbi:hypothetical protein WJX72_007239 [[Myrmecia] bisecta]|uniref:Cation/H+ exchanger transmembrane domain-containing protein n=1 Tax=[Myrmecia] bisecta TaxID=41462 RepID=A0AAW1P3B1_9CHLO